jgi:ectoine hydroxylase-related dioxygenase (phytanoyl-CoA dioxygenase family)
MDNAAAHVAEFKEQGYTILRGFNAAWIERWRPVFHERYERELSDAQRGAGVGVGQPRMVLRNLLQDRPELFLPSLVDDTILDLLESLMGPVVGFDSLQVAMTPSMSVAEASDVRAWHRDMWSLAGWSGDYLPPKAVNVLTYLQSGPEYGSLRVIPGSHRGDRYVDAGSANAPQPGEQIVELRAGDTVMQHSSLLHSTAGNHSGDIRIFASYFYTECWLPKREDYQAEPVQSIVHAARARGDQRVARLFEPDNDVLLRRTVDHHHAQLAEEELRQRWVAEDRAARESHGG